MNQITTTAATVADNSCDWEYETTIIHASGLTYDEHAGYDITTAWGNGVEYTARLRWLAMGDCYVSREIAVAMFGAANIEAAEATASERYTEMMGRDGAAA